MATDPARLLELAFDPEVRLAEDALSQRILDAALGLAADSGLRHLTIDDVAARADVGRMTVYRRFGSKGALVDALAVRECRRCLADISAAIDRREPFADRAVELFVVVLRIIREHPLLARLARVEPGALVGEFRRDGSAVFGMVHRFLIGMIGEAQATGEMIAGDPAVLAEVGLRLGVSFVLMPDSALALGDEAATRATFRRLIVPMVSP